MMKSLKMGKVLGSIKRKNASGADAAADLPEAIAARNVKSFCEAGAPNNSGDEVLYLPPIVDAAESSPRAAAECARLIRKYLKKDYWSKPSCQYNAIMITRILADNPGATFTRNMDQKFVDVVKELLRSGRDPSVHQLLMETLDTFENTKSYDEGLTLLIDMWKKEKEKVQKQYGRTPQPPAPHALNVAPFDVRSQNYFARSHSNKQLPSPVELASRLEEARTSANLLQQVVTSTPPAEVLNNDLIKEFADRCTSASRSIQMYMSADSPAPDNDTMESLIDTNEQLQASLSLHQRAMLNARKLVGIGAPGSDTSGDLGPPQQNGSGSSRRPSPNPEMHGAADEEYYEPPPGPPLPHRKPVGNGKGKERDYDNAVAGPSRSHTPPAEEDPFRDPQPAVSGSGAGSSSRPQDDEPPRLAFEPFHPGFSATSSYLNRQDSALGKETMHGGSAPMAPTKTPPPRPDESEDLYDVTPPRNKQPVYRY
ncbi:uncharacterized protein BCR38DRAFT_158692 [Pseudomassariella vexata]|uniref:GAT domain-containing protein n=1 Tax=Pseudomassariella vexata TaxID=1141098 RepID=A0A1Y2E7P7_9PEZI|nr:uncharacterized protein BCR38DRAFT_158692 [Pseudomassariella vexata]ORY67457.1 hypothetical protein BCR38DRAFT_158692 [Pseudomassariella vexata]